jgi:hypothetical protein
MLTIFLVSFPITTFAIKASNPSAIASYTFCFQPDFLGTCGVLRPNDDDFKVCRPFSAGPWSTTSTEGIPCSLYKDDACTVAAGHREWAYVWSFRDVVYTATTPDTNYRYTHWMCDTL